ncbi:MAG: hypothetical protein O9293_02520 [Porphyrobacter sp.]|nr:hypothetical protein [Porphyrobacter sp.]
MATHKAFAPLLGVWGALLGGLVIMVMPYALVGGVLDGTLLGTWGEVGQAVFAAVMATLFGSAMFGFGAIMHSRVERSEQPSMVELAMRQVTPINPAQDLGSRRLDDPVEPRPEPAAAPAPIELDLAQFAELPGRNAVWVEDIAHEAIPAEVEAPEPPAPEPAEPAVDPIADIRARRLHAVAPLPPLPPLPGQAALARLRATPTNELSLVEMVERFAGALHEHRETPPNRDITPADLAAREAALAEALKAMSALSGGTPAVPRRTSPQEPLRAALSQLQPRRGAA